MLKKIVHALMGLFCCSLGAHASADYLVVHLNSGQTFNYEISSLTEISFTSDEIRLETKDGNVAYAIADFDKYTYQEGEKSSLSHTGNNGPCINQDGDVLKIRNISSDIPVSLVKLDGKILSCTKSNSDGCAEITLPTQKGVYAVVIGKYSFNVIRK